MKSCSVCRARKSCRSVCAEVEARLPKDETGRDTHHEVFLGPEGFTAAAERYSHEYWRGFESAPPARALDLSGLTRKERSALAMLADGLSQREAAARLKISRASFRSRVDKAKRKLQAARFARFVEGGVA